MSQIRFPCPGCGATLGIASNFAGRLVACPSCKHRTTAPAFEVVDEPAPVPPPPPPPPLPEEREEARVRFPCSKCGTKLKVPASRVGQAVPCPSCGARTLVPEQEEVGTYGLDGVVKTRPRRRPAEDAPIAAWWPDARGLDTLPAWRRSLAEARDYAERGLWKRALTALHGLYERGVVNDLEERQILHRPLAYCLSRWAAREFEPIADGGSLSKPVRKILKRADEMHKWGGSFNTSECPLCERHLAHLVGTTQIRTSAGSAYVCCAAPTPGDSELLARVRGVWNKLTLATNLDPENPEVCDVLSRLPWWYKAVDLSAGWWARTVVDPTADGGGGGGIAGALLGDALGEALGNLLSG